MEAAFIGLVMHSPSLQPAGSFIVSRLRESIKVDSSLMDFERKLQITFARGFVISAGSISIIH